MTAVTRNDYREEKRMLRLNDHSLGGDGHGQDSIGNVFNASVPFKADFEISCRENVAFMII